VSTRWRRDDMPRVTTVPPILALVDRKPCRLALCRPESHGLGRGKVPKTGSSESMIYHWSLQGDFGRPCTEPSGLHSTCDCGVGRRSGSRLRDKVLRVGESYMRKSSLPYQTQLSLVALNVKPLDARAAAQDDGRHQSHEAQGRARGGKHVWL